MLVRAEASNPNPAHAHERDSAILVEAGIDALPDLVLLTKEGSDDGLSAKKSFDLNLGPTKQCKDGLTRIHS